jgi:hypothetical protein
MPSRRRLREPLSVLVALFVTLLSLAGLDASAEVATARFAVQGQVYRAPASAPSVPASTAGDHEGMSG